ncbi:hypothetical protein [Streptomyces sp. SID11385]|uniref:hypothetical protein n=1 Tax=Streptomyces sp. SID11385 TaxID=2706031 RepID=UPI0013C55171|nr:hypothetical protein [Streptomyces sp. SID11385]NEA42748.1 hypothetical protein [Streptomyces sp. SID11385]
MEQNATQQAYKRCADCGAPGLRADSVHTECRHCRKCFQPANCGYDHDQWADKA